LLCDDFSKKKFITLSDYHFIKLSFYQIITPSFLRIFPHEKATGSGAVAAEVWGSQDRFHIIQKKQKGNDLHILLNILLNICSFRCAISIFVKIFHWL